MPSLARRTRNRAVADVLLSGSLIAHAGPGREPLELLQPCVREQAIAGVPLALPRLEQPELHRAVGVGPGACIGHRWGGASQSPLRISTQTDSSGHQSAPVRMWPGEPDQDPCVPELQARERRRVRIVRLNRARLGPDVD